MNYSYIIKQGKSAVRYRETFKIYYLQKEIVLSLLAFFIEIY